MRCNMARQWSADKELDDMTECSICTEMFTDPRVLPCIHTLSQVSAELRQGQTTWRRHAMSTVQEIVYYPVRRVISNAEELLHGEVASCDKALSRTRNTTCSMRCMQ